MNCKNKSCPQKCPSKCCCPFPKCLLAPKKNEPSQESLKLKKYLSLPFPEDDI